MRDLKQTWTLSKVHLVGINKFLSFLYNYKLVNQNNVQIIFRLSDYYFLNLVAFLLFILLCV